MFHAVPLHPKLQIGSNWYHQWFGLDLRWNVQQETWCQHNFNPESVLNWLVPARDFKIVYIPCLGIYKYGTILSVTYMIMIRYMHSNSVPVSFASQILISNQNQQNPSPGRSSCFISHLNIHKFVKFNGTPTWGTNLWISLEILLTITMSGLNAFKMKLIRIEHLEEVLMATNINTSMLLIPLKELWCFV